ncbi:hypothetical protein EDD85DRAFT_972527 [Armillaria nabsnona]|nr:hypothetical protein EDD85DRAFT_972527 [Armillaria nabsnona]
MADHSMAFGDRVDFEAAQVEAVHWFGGYIIDLLCSTINEETGMQVVQIAMQRRWFNLAQTSSPCRTKKNVRTRISAVYMQRSKQRVIRKSRRAITRSGSKYESLSDVKKEWIKIVVWKLAIVLIFTGWTTNPPWEAFTSFLTKRYWERIEEIVHMDLDRGMGEGVVSEDTVIFSVGGGSSTSFDGDGELTMLYSDHVLCTCELGAKVSQLVQKDGYSLILVKPKVVLCLTMSEIIPPKKRPITAATILL